jgi:hypothetical protein
MVSKLVPFMVLCCDSVCVAAQDVSCEQIASMARMARARSSRSLIAEKQKAGDSYRAQVVFASRAVELRPKDPESAVRLLNLIPQNDVQQAAWMTLGDSLCDRESVGEMNALGRLRESLSRNLAKAVLLVQDKMQVYVSYAITATQDPHSDYAIQMKMVCEVRHPAFEAAVNNLPPDKRDWLGKHILDPAGCRVLARPEVE